MVKRSDVMAAEFVDGPFDGSRVRLQVQRLSPTQIRVLEGTYTWLHTVTMASQVESEAES